MVSNVFADICKPEERCVDPKVLEDVLFLAVEIAREGREGRKIGTLFIIGDTDEVLKNSRPLILDPLVGHPRDARRISSADVRETIKELAQLDGAFVISGDGVALSAARYIDVSSKGVRLPLGLGSRHMAGASITMATKSVAVVVSESSVVRVFDNGDLISEIIPELWMLRQQGFHDLGASVSQRSDDSVTVRTKTD